MPDLITIATCERRLQQELTKFLSGWIELRDSPQLYSLSCGCRAEEHAWERPRLEPPLRPAAGQPRLAHSGRCSAVSAGCAITPLNRAAPCRFPPSETTGCNRCSERASRATAALASQCWMRLTADVPLCPAAAPRQTRETPRASRTRRSGTGEAGWPASHHRGVRRSTANQAQPLCRHNCHANAICETQEGPTQEPTKGPSSREGSAPNSHVNESHNVQQLIDHTLNLNSTTSPSCIT